MDYNLLKVAYVSSSPTTDSVAPLTNQSLSYDNLLALVDGVTTGSGVAVAPQKYIGISADLGRDFYCKDAKIYVNDAAAGYIKFFYKTRAAITWSGVVPTWNASGYYEHSFGQSIIGSFRAFYGNSSATVTGTCYDIQLLNWDEAVEFGTDGEMPDTPLELPYTYSRPTSLAIYNNNATNTYAIPRIYVDSTGYYEADRIIKLSKDYDEELGISGTWVTIDDGLKFPEEYPWSIGTFSNTAESLSKVSLTAGTTSGYWQSPVIDIPDPQYIVLYAYGSQKSSNAKINYSWTSVNELLQVKASDTAPIEDVLFSVVSGDHNNPFTTWKTEVFESNGTSICSYNNSTCAYKPILNNSLGYTPMATKYWAQRFHGDTSLTRNFRYGAKTNINNPYLWEMGRTVCGATSCTGTNVSSWNVFYTNNIIHAYYTLVSRMIKVTGSSNLWWAYGLSVYDGSSSAIAYRVKFALINDMTVSVAAITAVNDKAITSPSVEVIYNDACLATDTNGIWILLYNSIQKYNIYGALTSTFAMTASTYEILVPTATADIHGFWALSATSVAFFEQSADAGGTLTEVVNIGPSTRTFQHIRHGCADMDNNLWFSDFMDGKVYRLNWETKTIDIEVSLPNVSSVKCSPGGLYCYAYVYNDLERGGDSIYRIDNSGAVDYLCAVPGAAPAYNDIVHMDAYISPTADYEYGYFNPVSTDPLWGTSGSLQWQEYPNANMGLPKGRYKQFRITLQRNAAGTTSPVLEKLRIPAPLILDAIGQHDYRYVYIDTDVSTGAAAGRYDISLLVFWPEV